MGTAAGVRRWWAGWKNADGQFDSQDRAIWGGFMEPSNSAPPDDFGATFQQRQNYARAGWSIVPNGSFDEQDRNHWAGFIQSGNTDAIHLQTFSVTYTLTPTFSIASAFDGLIDSVLNSIISTFKGAIYTAPFPVDDPGEGVGTTSVPVNYQICSRTGWKIVAHPKNRLIKDGYGDYVRIESYDPVQPQDYLAARGNDRQVGAQNPEASEDTFISADIDPSEL